MRVPALRLFAGELIVDSFAGGGGASYGIEMALGRSPDIAINHDREAIAMHAVNHPSTKHFCEDVWQVDPVKATGGKPVGLMWLSPDCKHFSKAKGGKPVEKKIRGLAWIAVKWAKAVKPRVICLENVEEFEDWGPLTEDGKPCPLRRGLTFRRFVRQLERCGYQVEHRELIAADYGAPTTRKRLFLIARRDGLPIIWPEATHGKGRAQAWRSAAECIDWSLPCPSIFERTRPLAENTLRRIGRGIKKYVIEAAKPFIVRGSEKNQLILHPRLQTGLQDKNPGSGLVNVPFLTEHANGSGQRIFDIAEPLRTQCGEVKGGHFAMVAAFMAKHYGGHETPGTSLQLPLDTVTAQDHNALVASNLVKLRGTSTAQATDEPLHTISSQGTHFAEVRAFLLKYYGADQDPRLELPLHTVTSRDRFGLVTVHGEQYAIADIGMRMLQPRELFRAQGFPDSYRIEADVVGKPFTKSAQVRMCGNSVCPPVAAAIVLAQFQAVAEEVAA